MDHISRIFNLIKGKVIESIVRKIGAHGQKAAPSLSAEPARPSIAVSAQLTLVDIWRASPGSPFVALMNGSNSMAPVSRISALARSNSCLPAAF